MRTAPGGVIITGVPRTYNPPAGEKYQHAECLGEGASAAAAAVVAIATAVSAPSLVGGPRYRLVEGEREREGFRVRHAVRVGGGVKGVRSYVWYADSAGLS